MTTIYTTPSEIHSLFKYLDTNFITDDALTVMIEVAQGQIDCLMKTSHLADFTMTKHAVIKQLCTSLVILECIECSPDSFLCPEDRNTTVETALTIIKLDMKFLSDPVRVELLK